MKILKTAVIVISIFAITTLFLAGFSFAEIPRIINYQGKLTDTEGKPVSDGTYSVTFRIYEQEAGGSPLWYETQSVLVQKGIFSTQIGATKDLNLPFDKPYYLGIKVGSDTEMTPRQRLTSSAYAFRAKKAEVAERAQILEMPAKNGEMLYYQNGWCTISAPPKAGMYLVSQAPDLPPIWAEKEIVIYNERLEERQFDSSMRWEEHLSVEIMLPHERHIEFTASIDMRYIQWATPQARVTIDDVVYTDVVSNPNSSWQTFNLTGATNQRLSAGKHTVKIEIRTTTNNLAAWRNAKLRVKAPI